MNLPRQAKQLYWRKKTTGYKEAYASLEGQSNVTKRGLKSESLVDEHKFKIDNIPILYWPDGRYCLEASLFIYHLSLQGMSTLGGGGTLVTYAAHLSHLIRFCFISNIDFSAMTSSRFTLFMRGLRAETHVVGGEVRKRRRRLTVLKMGRLYLNFFEYVGSLHNIVDMVQGVLGAQRRQFATLLGRGWVTIEYWHHRSFPKSDEIRRRRPLADMSVQKLFEANAALGSTAFKRRRRYVMLLLLKATGCRRMEVAMLRVSAIRKALKEPGDLVMLTLPNVKHHGLSIRKVPISRGDLLQIEKYIAIDRARIVRKQPSDDRDEGILLLNERTGTPLTPNTVSAEFTMLARAAGISSNACAHMMRHRYLVKLFIELILESNTRDAKVFQGLLLSSDTLSFKLRERSGHLSNAGVEWYTKIALSQILRLEKSLGRLQANEILKSFPASVDELEFEIRERQLGAEAALALFRQFVGQKRADITRAMNADLDLE